MSKRNKAGALEVLEQIYVIGRNVSNLNRESIFAYLETLHLSQEEVYQNINHYCFVYDCRCRKFVRI